MSNPHREALTSLQGDTGKIISSVYRQQLNVIKSSNTRDYLYLRMDFVLKAELRRTTYCTVSQFSVGLFHSFVVSYRVICQTTQEAGHSSARVL